MDTALSPAGNTVRPKVGREQGSLNEEQEGNAEDREMPSQTARGSQDPGPEEMMDGEEETEAARAR